jgi:hypothetical protein
MARKTDRPLSDAEFLKAFRMLVKRLDSHISSVDRGERHVRDDLAAVLRILLTRGKGENAIGRFLSRHRMSAEATISLPAFDGSSVWLSLGSLPWDATGGTKTRVVSIPTGLIESTALKVNVEGQASTVSWEQLIKSYGNTYGAHLSTTLPAILDGVRLHGVCEADIGTYMLRSLGVLASGVSHELLRQVDPTHSGVAYDFYFEGVQLLGIACVRLRNSDIVTVEFSTRRGRVSTALLSFVTPDGSGAKLDYVQKEAPWDTGPVTVSFKMVRKDADPTAPLDAQFYHDSPNAGA